MKTTQFIVSTATFAALTSSASAVTLILPIGQTVDNGGNLGILLQDPVGGGLGWLNATTGVGFGIGTVPPAFVGDDISALIGSGIPITLQYVVGGSGSPGGMLDVSPAISADYIAQIHSSETCTFNESALIVDGASYPGKIALQDLSPGDHFFNFRVTRISDGEQHFGFVKYSSNPDTTMNVIVAGFNTTAGEAAVCPDGLGLVPAAMGMGLVMLRHARSRRATVAA